MSILQTQEWQTITDAINKKKEKILKEILQVNAEMNEVKFSKRDLLIAQMEMLDYFLQKPKDIANYKVYATKQE